MITAIAGVKQNGSKIGSVKSGLNYSESLLKVGGTADSFKKVEALKSEFVSFTGLPSEVQKLVDAEVTKKLNKELPSLIKKGVKAFIKNEADKEVAKALKTATKANKALFTSLKKEAKELNLNIHKDDTIETLQNKIYLKNNENKEFAELKNHANKLSIEVEPNDNALSLSKKIETEQIRKANAEAEKNEFAASCDSQVEDNTWKINNSYPNY